MKKKPSELQSNAEIGFRAPQEAAKRSRTEEKRDPIFQKAIDRWLRGGWIAEDLIAVRFDGRTKKDFRDTAIQDAGGLPLKYRIEITGEKYFLVRAAKNKTEGVEWSREATEALSSKNGVVRVAPVFVFGGGYAVATDRLIVRTSQPAREMVQHFHKMGGRLIQKENESGIIRLGSSEDPLAAAMEYSKQDWIKDATPDFAMIQLHSPMVFADEIESPQWADQNAPWNYPYKSTNAYDGWNQGYHGHPSIRIAVVDFGVDTEHADLAIPVGNRHWDATDKNHYQEPAYGIHHGTAVAGLAGALPEDAIGVRGIGSGCSLVSIKIGKRAPNGADSNYFKRHIQWAIRWAWYEYQSDVINLSFAWPYSTYLDSVIWDALNRGRGGKGCIIVASAGNNGGAVSYPGNLKDVLTVTATNQYDEIKHWESEDGEKSWASCYGEEVDVAAPGVTVLSTANTDQDYALQRRYGLFSGTSFAAPQVSGLAGLILSVNNRLSGYEVREIIKQSADKAGRIPYEEGRNDFFGYGRINITNAIELAKR